MNAILTSLLAKMGVAPSYIANFDSTTAMLRATAAYLRGEDFPGIGVAPPQVEPLANLVNLLPQPLQEFVYTFGSAGEGISPKSLGDADAEVVARWMTSQYPRRQYPAVAIGSASGALVHLCAALGIPWLPQTFLIPVKHDGIDPDEPKAALKWGIESGWDFLHANPDLQLHHMHDPNQDRLTLRGMTYFRVKRLRLGKAYEEFLENCLAEGGTIFIVECQAAWPVTLVGDRYFFQFGAKGGATIEDYFYGGKRVREYLERYRSPRKYWDPPVPDIMQPEAEWGFAPALRSDIERFASKGGNPIRRIVFEEAEHLSPFVAELYRWWYKERQLIANRLLVESFILMEPKWALRTGSVPFWMLFNKQNSFDWLEAYLKESELYDEIYMMLFSHGADSVGLVPIERWRTLLDKSRRGGEFVGVDVNKYPRDFASFARYYTDIKRVIPYRYPLPGSLSLQDLDRFIDKAGERFRVRWLEHSKPAR